MPKTMAILITIVALLTMATACGQPTSNTQPTTVDWVADGTITTGEYSNSATYGNYELNYRSDTQHIYIGMKAKTAGWVAIGIKPTSQMKDADMIFGFVVDGQTSVFDMFSTGTYGPHPPDSDLGGSDNILISAGSEAEGYTIIEFKRLKDTGDQYDKAITQGNNPVIWAYGSADEITPKHSTRGSGTINLE